MKRFFGFFAALLGLVPALTLPGCGDSEPGIRASPSSAPGSEEFRRLLHKPSASMPVAPSTQDQTLTVLGVGVTVPGALLGAPQMLSVTALPDVNLSRPMREMQTVGVYDITLGAASTFDEPLMLEFPYNAAALGDGAAQGKNLWVAYWDTARQQWVRANASVDVVRQRITVSTDHLSTWWIYRLRGYDYVPKGRMSWFEVYFNPKHVNPRTDVAGQSMQGLAEEVLAGLETARENYKTAGFKLPSTTTSVFIADVPDSEWGKWGGAIDLKRSELIDLNRIRSDSAHELFHAVQNQYYYTAGMAHRFWLVEGTPDFMAYRYGWNGSIPSQIEPLTPSWFEHSPFENLTDVDAYPLGNFLEYLSTVRSLDIKKLWDDVAQWRINVPQGFRSAVAVQTGTSFDTAWNEFIEYAVFGKPALATKAMRVLPVDKASNEESRSYALKAGFTMTLVEVKVQACDAGGTRKARVGTTGAFAGSSKVALWKADPLGSNREFVDDLNAGRPQSDWIDLGDNKRVFALLLNNGAADIAASLTVQAQGCSEKQFSKLYAPQLLYQGSNWSTQISFKVSGNWSTLTEEFFDSGFEIWRTVRVSIPTPASNETKTFSIEAGASNFKCEPAASYDCLGTWGTGRWIVTSGEQWLDAQNLQPPGSLATVTVTKEKCKQVLSYGFQARSYTKNPNTGQVRQEEFLGNLRPITFIVDCL